MNTKILSCSIFKNEIEYMIKNGDIDLQVDFINSMLHIYPEKLQIVVENYVEKNIDEKIIIAYGDCYPYMLDLEKNRNIVRTQGINCCEIIMGRELYRKLRGEGAFFLMPEWAERWQEVIESHLGLNPENAKYLMKEFHTKLIYLDTGLKEIPYEKLKSMSEYVGLPYEVLTISLLHLKESIMSCLERVK